MLRPSYRTRLRRGRLCHVVLAAVVASTAGCESWRTAKIDHPVLGPPPPRLSWTEAPADEPVDVAEATSEPGSKNAVPAGYTQVSLSEPAPIAEFSVMAIVNGEPVLAGEILAPFRPHFAKMHEQGASERQVEQLKIAVLHKHLPQRIETALLVQSLRLMLKSEQLKKTEEMLDKEFAKHLKEIMPQHKANSTAELEKALAATGTSLAEYEQHFKNQQLAMLYLGMKTGEKTTVVGRQDIVEYYSQNIEKYEHQARAQFQLLMTTFDGNGGRDKARAKIETALAEIGKGDDFGNAVLRHSDGPRSKEGGQHDWFRPGEFNSKQVDEALFSLPVGEISPIFELPTGFVVVKVTAREPAGRTPLAEVQDTIRKTLQDQARMSAVQDLFAELRTKAVITTYLE